jgi:GT2 family glycosyltransferase
LTSPDRVDVSILIVSYNARAMTLEAISSAVRETRDVSYEIIIVDNASNDGSVEAIAAHPAQPALIALNENIGFGRANNLAAEHATGSYVLLLNPDTVVCDRAIDRLVAFARANPQALIWGAYSPCRRQREPGLLLAAHHAVEPFHPAHRPHRHLPEFASLQS